MLFAVATSNYVDRYIIAVLLEPIRREFEVSDTLLGVLSGVSFALIYAVMGLPAARWADRYHRPRLVTAALVVWSVMTAVCAMAQSFWQLALARVGVGVGEAGSMPASQSLLVDYFPPGQRGRALAVFTSASTVGYLLAFVGGSLLLSRYGWRATLAAAAVPGLVIALLSLAVLKEPRGARGAAPIAAGETIGQTARALRAKASYGWTLAALTLWAFFAYGAVLFVPSFLTRTLRVDPAEVGVLYGVVSAAASLLGTLGGGWLADRLGRHDLRWTLWLPALALACATPLYVLAFMSRSLNGFLLMGGAGAVLVSAALPATFTAIHAVCGSGRRATSVAILLFFMSFIGASLGPVITGAVSDLLSKHSGTDGIANALALMSLAMPVIAIMLGLAARTVISDVEA